MGGPVASELVCNEPIGNSPLTFQELAKEPPSWFPIPKLLQEDVDCVSIMVNRPPKIEALSPECDERLIWMPNVLHLVFPISQSSESVPTVVEFVVAQSPPGPYRATDFNQPALTHWSEEARKMGVSGFGAVLLWGGGCRLRLTRAALLLSHAIRSLLLRWREVLGRAI